MSKKVYCKFYKGTQYLGFLSDFTFGEIQNEINSGQGELSLNIPYNLTKQINYIEKNNRVDIFVFRQDNNTEYQIYSGFITEISIDSALAITDFKCAGIIKQLSSQVLTNGTTGVHTRTEDPSLTLKWIVDRFVANNSGTPLNYLSGTGSVATTSTSTKQKFAWETYTTAIVRVGKDFAPAGWYWWIDANNILYFQNIGAKTTADHTFGAGEVANWSLTDTMENVVNTLLYDRGSATTPKQYQNTPSVAKYGAIWQKVSDNGTDLLETLQIRANQLFGLYAEPKPVLSLTISDQYNIESLRVGQTFIFVEPNGIVSQELRIIKKISYTINEVIIESDFLRFALDEEIYRISQRTDQQDWDDAPTTYS